MYLKSIEVQGFKSFANKIVFEFHNGITGIVGPNGSGKSNVADAVRWVLGEQKIKQLRGTNMQDVIFSGTENRKAQGFAYVAITLDNSDHQLPAPYDEVTVSRRLYRSGESEYMINGGSCRLKDINEIFYDTGIGKEGYSIIGQGQIDKILSGKPEERRELFDEAAGIVKFKRRKNIAQKNLENEKQNLIRVNDILSELEKQIGPLEKQAEAAKIYLKRKEELKVLDANMFLLESDAIKELLKKAEEHIQIVETDLEENSASSEILKKDYERLEKLVNELTGEIEKDKQELNELQILESSMIGQIDVFREQIHTEQMNEDHIAERMKTINSEIERKKQEKEDYKQEKIAVSEQLKDLEEKKKAAESELHEIERKIQIIEMQLEAANGNIIHALNEKASLNVQQQRYETMLEQIMIRKSEVCQKIIKYKTDEAVQKEAVDQLEEEHRAVMNKIALLTNDQELQQKESIEKEQSSRQLSVMINEKQQEYHTTLTKLESLKNIAERYDGYGNSIRKIMEVRDRIQGIHGVIADLIAVEKKYETAIETALGGTIQNIVTDTDFTAKQLIEYLKKNKFGSATFLPLTSVGSKGSFHQGAVLKEPGVLGIAHELVQTDKIYEGLLKHILGRIVVVDNIDHALALAKKYHYGFRIVTLEGELLNTGGSLTGGAFRNSSNLLGRKREIEELEERSKKIQIQSQKLSESLQKEEFSLASIRKMLETTKQKLQAEYLSENTLKISINQADAKRKELSESYRDLTQENGLLEQQITDINKNQDSLNSDALTLNQQETDCHTSVETLSGLLEQERADREAWTKKYSQVQMEFSNISQKDSFILENQQRIVAESQKLSEEYQTLKIRSGESKQIVESKYKEIRILEDKIADEKIHQDKLQALIEDKTRNRDEKAKEQKSFVGKKDEISEKINQLNKELFRLQSQKEKLEEKLENHINYMWSEYELTLTIAGELKKTEWVDLGALKKQAGQIKNQIKELGNVNVNAIEDYKEVSERYTFLKTQHDDLVASEKALAGIIQELDTGMRKQFEEKFKEIKIEFDKVFKELFGGGRGTLELIEEEDVLEAGIQIISQPPGKKLQNMMQLSGGEKALTAISLLFAIQNLKPSPFCLLDEIEAALDDSNVGRFAGYLHKLTKKTQFIIITHRRGTMVASDRLYGITMQEKGVSTLISVNLIESELDE